MKLNFFLGLLLFGFGPLATAACLEVPVESFSAEFKIVNVEKAQSRCAYDEKMQVLPKALFFPEKGCVLQLEVVKIKKGVPPKVNVENSGYYGIYETGSLCSKKAGEHVVKNIESMRTHCCSALEGTRLSELEMCSMKPEPKLLTPHGEEYVRCTSKDVYWRIVKK